MSEFYWVDGRGVRRPKVHYLTVRGEYAVVPLTKGKHAMVDASDIHLLGGFNWQAHFSDGWYARRRGQIKMHHAILGTASQIDHKNGNGLDNRRHNLRSCTGSQNCANRKTRLNATGFRGVSTKSGRWQAGIRAERKMHYLGLYPTPERAAIAYDIAAKKFFGEFAKTNF